MHGGWSESRKEEAELSGNARKPAVIIVGAGQAGLQVAARLKALDVPALIVERNSRVGDQWRKRYDALSLHSPVCAYSRYTRRWCE